MPVSGWSERPREEPRDILRDDGGKKPRFLGLRNTLGFLLGTKVALGLVVVVVVGGIGLLFYERVIDRDEDYESASREVVVDPEYGRPLNAREVGLAARWGEPMFLGKGGMPLMRVHGSGEVREVTPVEIDFPSGEFYVIEQGDVVWAPGRYGWGVWWKLDRSNELTKDVMLLGRQSWVAVQNRELDLALGRLEVGVTFLLGLELEVWRSGQGQEMLDYFEQYRREYDVWALEGNWGVVPFRWRCDGQLEIELREGITPGCPSGEVAGAVSRVWREIGMFSEELHYFARVSAMRDTMTSKSAANVNLSGEMVHLVEDLSSMENHLMDSLSELSWYASNESLVMDHVFAPELRR